MRIKIITDDEKYIWCLCRRFGFLLFAHFPALLTLLFSFNLTRILIIRRVISRCYRSFFGASRLNHRLKPLLMEIEEFACFFRILFGEVFSFGGVLN